MSSSLSFIINQHQKHHPRQPTKEAEIHITIENKEAIAETRLFRPKKNRNVNFRIPKWLNALFQVFETPVLKCTIFLPSTISTILISWYFLCIINHWLAKYTGCSGKIVFFHSSLQNLPRLHIALRDLQSSQRNASVQSLLLAGLFCTTNSSGVLARGRWQTFENFWEKTQYLMNTLYMYL